MFLFLITMLYFQEATPDQDNIQYKMTLVPTTLVHYEKQYYDNNSERIYYNNKDKLLCKDIVHIMHPFCSHFVAKSYKT